MNNEIRNLTKNLMIENMLRYGGGFVQALAVCFLKADFDNTNRLFKAFPEYVEQYTNFKKGTK